MILLRNFDNVRIFFDLDLQEEIEKNSDCKINGWYKEVNGVFSGLLVIDNKLYFLFENYRYEITDNFKVKIEITTNQTNKLFNLLEGEKNHVNFSYSSPHKPLNISPFEYIDEDDFKWGEFIEKIVNDSNRKNNFIYNLMEE